MADDKDIFLAAPINSGTEYEDILMRNQQYAAEIERLTKELTAANDYIAECKQDIQVMLGFVRDISAERDEARRQVCRVLYTDKFMQRNHANLCGWDCFHDTDEADANNTLFNMTDGE